MSSSESDEELTSAIQSSKKRKPSSNSSNKKKKKKKKKNVDGGGEKQSGFIDDSAILSGEEDDEDDEEDEDGLEDNNDYERDGFVVDEDDDDDDEDDRRRRRRRKMKKKKHKNLELEDSDDESGSDDDDDDDDDGGGRRSKKKKSQGRVRRMRDLDMLNDDDLDLINEAKGITTSNDDRQRRRREEEERKQIMARSGDELRQGLFDDGVGGSQQRKQQRQRVVKRETFDEDGMDDFIDDDIGDQDHLQEEDRLERRRHLTTSHVEDEEGISAEMLATASDIFGNDYLNFMEGDAAEEDEEDDFGGDEDRKKKFRERGVGVTLGIDSDEEIEEDSSDDDDDDDLFRDPGTGASDEASKLKRKLERREKRQLAAKKKAEKRKARLRRAFEPVQLVENFCTDRDDQIRMTDEPERFFDWKTPHHDDKDEEEEEAMWIMARIPEITAEFFSTSNSSLDIKKDEDPTALNASERKQRSILDSIIHALRFMHAEKLEPHFIQKYRADTVTSPAVRDNLYAVMDQDAEWERLASSRTKVEQMLAGVTDQAAKEEAKGAEEENILQLKADLKLAQDKLDETLTEESTIKEQISELPQEPDDDEEDDDELFGDDDDDDDEDKQKKKNEKNKNKKQKESLEKHLKTVQTLLEERADKVAQMATQLKNAEQRNHDSLNSQSASLEITKKMARNHLWNVADYQQYLSSLTEYRHVQDVYSYMSLLKEGNESIREKNEAKNSLDANTNNKKNKRKNRTRRFDRDYYRTCVSEGLRSICYRFTLAPYRAGIKLEDNINLPDGFSYDRTLPGQESQDNDPRCWSAPVIEDADPTTFASDLVGSGELVFLTANQLMNDMPNDNPEIKDPLRGCRYAAAMELAYEPRIRRHLRDIYRQHALLTTHPTSKGKDSIDAFHEYYGLQLIHNKPIKDHFPMDDREAEIRKTGLSYEERKELDEEVKRRETESCIQYLNIIKAEATGHLKVYIHLSFTEDNTDDTPWYKKGREYLSSRSNQDQSVFVDLLEKVYLPPNGDTDEWNDERRKILRLALNNFLLPQFEAEARRDLREASIKIGIDSAAKSFHTMAMEGPYRPSHLLGENRFLVPTGDLSIVGVCCSSDGREATYLSAVTEQGEVNDHLAVPAGTKIDLGQMREKTITFLMQTRPAAVLVGTHGGLACRMLARKLGDMVQQATERWNNRYIQGQDEDDEEYEARRNRFQETYSYHEKDYDEDVQWKCNVDMVDDSIAQLFGRSIRGKKEFPDMSVNQKCSIAIARYGKDPLAELAYTWSVASDAGVFGAEMLFLNVHPLQQILPKSLLLREYERVLCRAVSEVGVDVNASISYEHLHGLLSFIPGLGPRKAASLKQSVIRIGGVIASRRELLAKRLFGPVVYNNAVAFLRIRDTDALSNQYLHPLDDTRLHPDVYHRNNWALKIAIDALEMGDNAAGNNKAEKEDIAITALREIKDDSHAEVQRLFEATKAEWERSINSPFNSSAWDPRINVPADSWRDKVEELDLDTFAEMIEQSGMGKWLSHLIMIKWEFRLPFEDPRKPMEPLAGDKLFRLLTGETDQTLCPGKEVTGKVFRNGDFGSRIKLEGDVPGFIPLRNLADGHVESAEDIVQVGSVVTAIVTEVKKEHLCVDLSLKMEDFRKLPSSWPRPESLAKLDPHFDRPGALNIEQERAKEREQRLEKLNLLLGSTKIGDDKAEGDNDQQKRSGRITRRACAHPAFRNAKHDEIERELKEGGDAMVGEALIRPSARNADYLAVHWLVRPGIMKVIEVAEEDKDTDASIGNILKIKNEVFSGIDELLGRYIMSMNDRVEQAVHHRKFLDKSEDEVDDELKAAKKKTPAGMFYYLCWNEQYPGYISLRYIVNSARSHHIGISPDGFVWGKKTYSNLDKLLNDFKINPRGPPGSSAARAGSSANKTKIQAPAPPKPTERTSRWGSRNTTTTTSSQSAGWQAPSNAPPPVPVSTWGSSNNDSGSGWGKDQPAAPQRPPPPSLPPPPSQGFQPSLPSGPPPTFDSRWGTSSSNHRPPPPSLPPPPHGYPPPPPQGAPMSGYPSR